MRARDIGERGFLSSIESLVRTMSGSKLGYDEDASDIPLDGVHLVINVDTFVRKTDWLLGMTPAQVGRKTAVMTLSDLIVKGAHPKATMLSMCMPEDYETTDAHEIVRGFSQYCLKQGTNFIGGDLGMADDIILTGVGIGTAHPDSIISRSGARDGDVIAVTDYFGLTSLAFKIVLQGLEVSGELRKRALEAAFKPELRISLISRLCEIDAVTSAMDSSDGLGITLSTMAEHSQMFFVVERLPLDEQLDDFIRVNMLDEMQIAMSGGEEFIPVLTISASKWDSALDIANKMGQQLIKIGHVQKGDSKVVFETSDGFIDVPSDGYDNLREWD
jgi:thiamine-monophosphate kinase